MSLSDAQLTQYERDGYLFLPGYFPAAQAAMLRAEADRLYATDREEVWRESTGAPRTAFAAHEWSEPFGRLGRHPRLIGPVEKILGGPVYMHQYKVNAKAAFDVTAANGPLLFIPGSHREGVYEAGHDLATTSYPLWTLDRATITRLAERGGIVAPTGPPGSVIMFHGCLVHASPPNISPFGRVIVYLSLCRVDNHIRRFQRAPWIAHRDFTPITALADDCLADLVEGASPTLGGPVRAGAAS
jgi:ectoine hydroxylase